WGPPTPCRSTSIGRPPDGRPVPRTPGSSARCPRIDDDTHHRGARGHPDGARRGTAITGVQLERNGLQYAADSAALSAAQAVDPSRIYTAGGGAAIHEGSARAAA